MKKKSLIVLSLLLLALTLNGCGIKFLEKAPPKPTPTPDLSNQGSIEIDPNDTDHMTLSTEEPEPTELPSSEESSESKEPESTPTKKPEDNKNQQIINDITFNMVEKEMWAKENISAYANANLLGGTASGLTQGSKVDVIGISIDEKVAMISIGSICFVDYSKLSNEPVEYVPEVTATPEPTQPPASEQPTEQPTEQPVQTAPPEVTQPPVTAPPVTAPPVTEEPKPVGGIPYPSNPSTTSTNFGVTFADENFSATIIATTPMNSGPGRANDATGFVTIDTFYAGTVVNCTGIGSNGYIRVALADGVVGFILNTDLIRN